MACKFLIFFCLAIFFTSVRCEDKNEIYSGSAGLAQKADEEPPVRADFFIQASNMDSSMLITLQSAVNAGFANYPNSSARVTYIRDFLDNTYTYRSWHVVEEYGTVAYRYYEHAQFMTYRNNYWVNYIVWSTPKF